VRRLEQHVVVAVLDDVDAQRARGQLRDQVFEQRGLAAAGPADDAEQARRFSRRLDSDIL
jgi:hypothetical protein